MTRYKKRWRCSARNGKEKQGEKMWFEEGWDCILERKRFFDYKEEGAIGGGRPT